MRKVFTGLALLLVLIVAAEFFFAAMGGLDASYRPHHVLGYVIFSMPIVMAVVAGLAKLPKRFLGMLLGIVALTGFQVLIAKVAWAIGGTAGPVVFGLHALGGMAIIALSVAVLRDARAVPAAA